MTQNLHHRDALKNARRIVVKAGSKVLVQSTGRPDSQRLKLLVNELAQFQNNGGEVAFVSSGAIGAGLEALGMDKRPTAIPDLQMAAAVGQTRLMSLYDTLFGNNKCHIGQVLLTHDVLTHRERHLNARNTLLNLIANRIVPIINENDTISTKEIKFGDNDILAALVAILIDADALVLLSSTDGLREPNGNGRTRRVSYIEEVDNDVLNLVADKQNKFSTGGMASKLESAQIAAHNGIPVVIADGRGFVQTHLPDHPVMQAIISGDREAFLEQEICNRQRGLLPPYGRLAALVISARDKHLAEAFARDVARRSPAADRIEVLGPAEAPISIVRGRHRWRLLVKAPREMDMQAYLRQWIDTR